MNVFNSVCWVFNSMPFLNGQPYYMSLLLTLCLGINYVLHHCCKLWVTSFKVCKINNSASTLTWLPSISSGRSSTLTLDHNGNTVIVSCHRRTWCMSHMWVGSQPENHSSTSPPPKRPTSVTKPSWFVALWSAVLVHPQVAGRFLATAITILSTRQQNAPTGITRDRGATLCHWQHQLMCVTGNARWHGQTGACILASRWPPEVGSYAKIACQGKNCMDSQISQNCAKIVLHSFTIFRWVGLFN